MYSEEDRQAILDKLVFIFTSIEGIDGAILVGSGAKGFTDRWSDIDFSVVSENEEMTRSIWDIINKRVLESFDVYKITYNEYGKNNYLSVILLDNFLEVDIGIVSLSSLSAKRKDWRILSDKSGKISRVMDETWEKRKLPDLKVHIKESTESIWYHMKNAAFAIKRGKLYRVIKELEELRDEIIEIKAIQENMIAKHYRDVDDMDEVFIKRLNNTFFKEVNICELTLAFVRLVDLYFDLIEEIYPEDESIKEFESRIKGILMELQII